MKYFFMTLLMLVGLTAFCQNLNGKYSGKSMLRQYSFTFTDKTHFEYTSTGYSIYTGKGTYSIKGNKIIFLFSNPEDTIKTPTKTGECGETSGNVMKIVVRDPDNGMFLACDYEVFDASGKSIQPRKSFMHCLFLNTNDIPDGSYIKIYHYERKSVFVKVNKNGCNEYLVGLKFRPREETIENGRTWEFNFFPTAKGFTLSEPNWSGEFIKE